jgi:DNA-binding NarL/FixJ family response regulator
MLAPLFKRRGDMRILIADDHPLYREAVATQIVRLYPGALVDEVSSLDELFGRVRDVSYDLFVVDYHMPGMSNEGVERLVASFPHTPVAIVSGTANHDDVRGAIEAGARGFVPKTATADQMASAIRMLLAGGTSVPAELLQPRVAETSDGAAPWIALLSPRELQVLKGVARGLANKQIGRELNLAEVTVKLHLRAVFRKTGVKSRAEAAVLATKAGLE